MTQNFDQPNPNEVDAQNQARALEKEQILNAEQKTFPSVVQIKGGVAVHPMYGEEKYRSGEVELKPNGTIIVSGFGFDHPNEFGDPLDVFKNYRRDGNEQFNRSRNALLPQEASWGGIVDPESLSEYQAETIADITNLEFCMPTSWGLPLTLPEQLPSEFSEELKDKALIAAKSTRYLNRYISTEYGDKGLFQGLIHGRPDLSTEIFKYVFRGYARNLGHYNGLQISDYFYDNPEMIKFVPESHRYYLAAIFLTMCRKDLSKVALGTKIPGILTVDEFVEKVKNGPGVLGFSDSIISEIKDQIDKLISSAESIKARLEQKNS